MPDTKETLAERIGHWVLVALAVFAAIGLTIMVLAFCGVILIGLAALVLLIFVMVFAQQMAFPALVLLLGFVVLRLMGVL